MTFFFGLGLGRWFHLRGVVATVAVDVLVITQQLAVHSVSVFGLVLASAMVLKEGIT
jgi:hypothetical protein